MPNSWLALHGQAPPQFTVCALFFASNSRFVCLLEAPLDTCLDSPLLCQPLNSWLFALHGLRGFENWSYAAPIGAFFCPEIRAFPGFGARLLQPFPKSLVTVKYYSNTKMAVNSC